MSTYYLYKIVDSTLPDVAPGSLVVDHDGRDHAPALRTWHLWSPLTKRVTMAYTGQVVARLCVNCLHKHGTVSTETHAGPCPGPAYVPYDPASDPDSTVRLDPAAEAAEYGVGVDEIGGIEDTAQWDLHGAACLTFGDDHEFGDGRGLHYVLSTGPGLPACVIRTVTPVQLRAYAQSLLALADRAAARRAPVAEEVAP